jgi:histidinol dehydrogenase
MSPPARPRQTSIDERKRPPSYDPTTIAPSRSVDGFWYNFRSDMKNVPNIVGRIISSVRKGGDAALCGLAKRFDGVRLAPKDLLVSKGEFQKARDQVSPSFLKALKECAANIDVFAQLEKKRLMPSWMQSQGSIRVGQLMRPVDSVGLYIPGGRFPYPSTVLMTAIPARVAGVKRIVMASPPKNLTPEVLTAAAVAGCEVVYRMGGAGAIAAMAYGTKTIARVDFIVGPGNQYVTEAKRQVFGHVGIDSLAGPSEVVIVADSSTPAAYVELDLQAQAEHDPEARALLLSTDRRLIREVEKNLSQDIAKRVTLRYVSSLANAIEEANRLAPEHLELLFRSAEKYLPRVRHAGAIFLGPATPAALGDYVAGPSHVLPTNRAARFSSGLSVATFFKRSSVIGFQARNGEKARWEAALVMGQTEGMEYHADSLRCRMTS